VRKSVGQRIADEAMEWVGTPFKWGQSVKGDGCDCKGLVQGVARELGRPEGESFYATFANYRVDRPVPSAFLIEGMSKLFTRVDEMKPGDVLVMKFAGQPAHMGIYAGNNRAVHAYHGMNAKVRDRDLSVLFHKFPLHSIWRWKRCR
jgi:cell wall-associated NlpC family hydrolase